MLEKAVVKGLTDKKYHRLIDDYITYLDLCIKDFSNMNISVAVKNEKLRLLEKAFHKEYKIQNSLLYRLQQEFVKENLSPGLLSDPFIAWHYLADNKFPTSEAQLSDLLNYIIFPLSRLTMALYDENPTTYLPCSSLFMFYFLFDELQAKTALVKRAKLNKRQRESKLAGLLKGSDVILKVVSSKALKFKMSYHINYGKCLFKKYKNNKQPKISFIDYLQIILYSIWQFMVIRKKSVTKKGI